MRMWMTPGRGPRRRRPSAPTLSPAAADRVARTQRCAPRRSAGIGSVGDATVGVDGAEFSTCGVLGAGTAGTRRADMAGRGRLDTAGAEEVRYTRPLSVSSARQVRPRPLILISSRVLRAA